MVWGGALRSIHSAEQLEQFPGALYFPRRLNLLPFFVANRSLIFIKASVIATPTII